MVSQCQVINKILDTKDYSLITKNNLTDAYFFNYAAEFNYLKNYYKQYKTVPDKETFLSIFGDFVLMEVHEPNSALLESLDNDYKASLIVKSYNEVKDTMEVGAQAKAIASICDTAKALGKRTGSTCTDLIHDVSRYDRYVARATDPNKKYYRTGFAELDNITGGIDPENENMVITARTGQGKTQMLVKMSVEAYLQGLRVGIYEGEMTPDKLGYRIDTMLGHINNKAINRGDYSENTRYKQYIERLQASESGSIKVITQNDIAGRATVGALRAFIEKEDIQIMFIDQYSLLESEYERSNKPHNEVIADIVREIKNLQVELKIPIISVAQLNRTKNEDKSHDTTQIGLSDAIPQYATTVLVIYKDEKAVSDENAPSAFNGNRVDIVIEVMKARDGGDGAKLKYSVDWNYGKFFYIPDDKNGNFGGQNADELYNSYETQPDDGINL